MNPNQRKSGTATNANAKNPLGIFLRVITVSLETMEIVNALPKLEEKIAQ
jgi:hypothetical protein